MKDLTFQVKSEKVANNQSVNNLVTFTISTNYSSTTTVEEGNLSHGTAPYVIYLEDGCGAGATAVLLASLL